MNSRIDQLVKTLLQKDTIDDCSLSELRQFADRHPYFGAAQLLLTKKLQQENDDEYTDQLQKTFLFFHNPVWVEHLLSDNGNATVITEAPELESTSGKEVEIEEVAEKEASPVNQITEGSNGKEAESLPLFEPYHTVDYFASQGIKLKEEEKPKDKFSQQLRSFTEWLKTMKKLPATELAPPVEKKVEEMAAVSLQDRDIVTEAMAEVWEKQGNHEKAIAVYNKLSLLDPSKRAYFAAKIEALKK
jgi:hypothetical protein